MTSRKLAVCIGCGCDDAHGCVEASLEDVIETHFVDGILVEAPQACHWLRLDRGARLGVCSACRGSVERWDAGDRDLDDLSLCS